MCQIILIRPGITDYDVDDRVQGMLSVPLNDEGKEEVHQLADKLSRLAIGVIYTSSGEPTQQTAQILADRLGVKVKKLDALRNLNLGLWQGLCYDEIRRKQPKVFRQFLQQPETVCPPKGEPFSEAAQRICGAIRKLAKRHKEGLVGVVASEPLAGLIRSLCRNEAIGDWRNTDKPTSRWEIIPVRTRQVLAVGER